MSRADLFRRAAELIATGKNRRDGYVPEGDTHYQGACDVLSCETLPYSLQRPKMRESFYDFFVDGEYVLMSDVLPDRQAQKVRVLALCFMAAMVEAGDA